MSINADICKVTRILDDETLRQDADILHLPNEILKRIGRCIATGPILEAGKSAVQWSRVCVLAHLLSHERDMREAMNNARLEKLWRKPINEEWDAHNRIFIY